MQSRQQHAQRDLVAEPLTAHVVADQRRAQQLVLQPVAEPLGNVEPACRMPTGARAAGLTIHPRAAGLTVRVRLVCRGISNQDLFLHAGEHA